MISNVSALSVQVTCDGRNYYLYSFKGSSSHGNSARAVQLHHVCLVETPFRIKVNLGNALVARTAAPQDQTRIFAIYQYPRIVLCIVTTVLQPACSSIYGLLDYAAPALFVTN